MTSSPARVFHRLTDGVSRLVAGDLSQLDALADLYAESTTVVHPMLPGAPPLRSRAEVRRHFAAVSAGARGLRFSAADVRVNHTADPEVIVAELTYRGSGPGGPLAAACVFVMRVREGKIVESHDYIDHAAFARAVRSSTTIVAIDHVQLAMPAGREDQAREFYAGLLELPERPKPVELAKRGGVWFENDTVKIHLGVDGDFRPAKKAHPALIVRGLAAVVDRLRRAGVEVVDDEMPGYHRVYVADPFGNRLELMEQRE